MWPPVRESPSWSSGGLFASIRGLTAFENPPCFSVSSVLNRLRFSLRSLRQAPQNYEACLFKSEIAQEIPSYCNVTSTWITPSPLGSGWRALPSTAPIIFLRLVPLMA